jgi:putative oxidoreductase
MRLASDVPQTPAGVLLLRFTVAGLMLFHGVAKLIGGVGPIERMLSARGYPGWLAFGVFIGEVVAPLLVILGIQVRVAALIMAVNMVVAIALAHPSEVLAIGKQGGYALELQAFFLLNSIAVALLAGRR